MTGSLFRGIIPEKYRYFSGNFRKNSAGNFRELTTLFTTLITTVGRLQRSPYWAASQPVAVCQHAVARLIYGVRRCGHVTTLLQQPRTCPEFFIGGQDRRAEGRERAWGSWDGSNPPHHQLGDLRELLRLVWGGASTAKGFPLFSAPRMTSSDTIILLIVDYHAAIGGKTPLRTPLAAAALAVCFRRRGI